MLLFSVSCAHHFSNTGVETRANELTGEKLRTIVIDLRSPGGTESINLDMTRGEASDKITSAELTVKGIEKFSKDSVLIVKADGEIFRFNPAAGSEDRPHLYARVIAIDPGSLDVWKKIASAKSVQFQGRGPSSEVTIEASEKEISALKSFLK